MKTLQNLKRIYFSIFNNGRDNEGCFVIIEGKVSSIRLYDFDNIYIISAEKLVGKHDLILYKNSIKNINNDRFSISDEKKEELVLLYKSLLNNGGYFAIIDN